MIADGEKLVSSYLRAHADVVAIGARVVGKPPSERRTPWVMVTMLDARDESQPTDHLISYLLQLDCYAGAAGGQPEANALAFTARAALRVMPAATHADAVVTGVRFTGMTRRPDTDIEPARDRVILTCEVFAHALVPA